MIEFVTKMNDIKILEENDDFMVVYKPPGMSVQGDHHHPTLIQLLKIQLATADLFPVHRLDKGTSGLVILAKNQDANRELSLLFQQRKVTKHYLALAVGKPLKKQGWVIGDMEKSRNGAYKLCRTQKNPARTYFISHTLAPTLRLYQLFPQTGKTHQLRVALKALGVAILGDELYSGPPSDRLYLHAFRLDFEWRHLSFHFEAWPATGELFLNSNLMGVIQLASIGVIDEKTG